MASEYRLLEPDTSGPHEYGPVANGDAPPRRVRVMRGQVVVREIAEEGRLWTPDANPREVHTHRGVVLAVGAPARTPRKFDGERWIGGAEVPMGFGAGDVVQYHFEHHAEAWTMPWPPDGRPATWLAQTNVDGVWEDAS